MRVIDDSDSSWRRVAPAFVVDDPKHDSGVRPSSASFKNDSDGMSAYAGSLVHELQLTAAAVIHGKPNGWGVAEHAVAYLRHDEGQVVTHDPIISTPPPHPCDSAHILVIGEKDQARRERLARNARWAVRPERL